jgi:hypothetical protein
MPKGMQAIYTQTVGVGGASQVIFNNIPQTYTDLYLETSIRGSGTGTSAVQDVSVEFNNDGSTVYALTGASGTNSAADSWRTSSASNFQYALFGSNNSATANAFGSSSMYIPRYSSNFPKQCNMIICNANDSTVNYWTRFVSGLYRQNSPITSIKIFTTSFLQNSTFTLYGISK